VIKADATFLGHSTVLVEMGGARLLTDPVLFNRVTVLRRTVSPLPPELYRHIDAVLISHLHLDHLDVASLRLLGANVPLIVPRGAGRLLRSYGFRDVSELPRGQSIDVADGRVRVTATRAAHSGFRPPFGPNAEAVGYVLQEGSESVYFAGDTDVFAEMADLAGVDLALLPVWGWGPRLGPGHMDPRRAAEALKVLQPRAVVPIHWGTLWPMGMGRVTPHRLQRPPLEFATFAAEMAPDVKVLITPPGETVPIPR
jgi:L-ascorbate metabolism protein UlaG (beta-lactamase superfamily)